MANLRVPSASLPTSYVLVMTLICTVTTHLVTFAHTILVGESHSQLTSQMDDDMYEIVNNQPAKSLEEQCVFECVYVCGYTVAVSHPQCFKHSRDYENNNLFEGLGAKVFEK